MIDISFMLGLTHMKKHSPAKWIEEKEKKLGMQEFYLRVYTILVVIALLAFIVISAFAGHKEALYYDAIFVPVVIITSLFQKHLRIPGTIFVMFTLLFLLNAAGGGLMIGGVRLYDLFFGPVRYDMIVHFYGSFVATFLVYNLIYPYINTTDRWHDPYLRLILILMAAGLGTLVETVEFSAVVFLHADGVGDYFNNAFDLVVNLLGAITGSIPVMAFHHRRSEVREITKSK